MGCECLNTKKIEKEIITLNRKENYFFIKNDNIKEFDTYINSMKTSDKNTFILNKNNENIDTLKPQIKNKKIIAENKNDKGIDNYNFKNISEKIMIEDKINIKKNINNFKEKKRKSETLIKNNSQKLNNNNLLKYETKKSKTKISQKKILSKELLNPIAKQKIKKPLDEFSQYIFDHINNIRANPQSFIQEIEYSKAFIKKNNFNKLIYKKNIKVALDEGLPAFEEAISILKFCKPMNKLIFEPKLVVKLPKNEEQIVNKNFFKNEIKNMIEKGIPIKSYWRDIIKDKETSFLMMIVDDTGIKAGMKRRDILNPNMKYIGIGSTTIGKYFICFVTFSDSKI